MIATLAMLSAVTVSTKAQLDAAIARARGGEVIQVAKGNYGVLTVPARQFSKTVTIQSANAAAPATFAKLQMQKVRNIVFKDLEVTRARGSDPVWSKLVDISDSTNVSFLGGFVHGPANGAWEDDMQGMFVRRSANVRVQGVSFHDLSVALIVEDTNGFNIESNFFSYISLDSMNIPGTQNGRIADNSMFLYFTAPGGHPDGIQCWTSGKKRGCNNLQIVNNKFYGMPGHEFQGIFFGDEAKVGGYDNIQITGNVMTNLMWHAIYIGGKGSGVAIRNNTVTADVTYRSWIRTVGPAALSGNVAPTYVIAGKQGVPAGNR